MSHRLNRGYSGSEILPLKTWAQHFSQIASESRPDKADPVGFSPANPNLALVASGARFEKNGILIVWDTKSGEVKQIYSSKKDILSAVFSPDGKTILFNDISDDIFLFDVESGVIIREYAESGNEKLSQPETSINLE